MNYKREVIGDNIGFSTIIDSKFNTCSLYVRFITELSNETSAVNSVACELCTMSNSKYRSIEELSDAAAELYGGYISDFSGRRGDVQILGFSSQWICNRFALEGEDITEEMLDIVHGCILSPDIDTKNGGFRQNNLKIAQNNIISAIESRLNDKRVYAVNRAYEIAFRGEPAENDANGTIEEVRNVTAESAFKAYMNLLETAQIEIFYVAPEENVTVAEMFRKSFAEINRNPREYKICSKSPLKNPPENVTEEFDVNQSKLLITLKSNSDDYFASDMFNIILGGTPVSKLFTNLREKMSLCYYCSSNFYAEKNTITIESGVDRANIEKAYNEILHQIDEIRNGNITEEEIQSALLMIDNDCSGIGDTPAQYFSWYFSRFCFGDSITPQEYLQKISEVTKDRIIRIAESFRLDSSYCMLNKESAE